MKEIALTRGLVALVDDEDFERLSRHKWYADSKGYARTYMHHPEIPGKRISVKMHRFVLGLCNGDEHQVDHRDLRHANNQKRNLRISTPSQNACNKSRQANNSSGFKGVTHAKNGKWRARVRVNNKRISLGTFETPEAAFSAYCQAASKMHGEFARLT
ncbi:AP2/ERF family transcription factor [Burkholderia vietnamiensis]|uniref:AP2/ERF family transcription factor n=1 Tax=Burkholderia vietnamiensis TaxID=60552 RepID=UPI0018DDEC14|nr:AP2/ERF family transcription factor [Burkholderia vietnamiensis]MBH9645053.1 AP2/ERF family transcription factor [Burkholderia vietnamiensis]